MSAEVHGLDQFYASPTGIVAKRLLRARLRAVWPELAGSEILGIGYAGPYIRLWRRRAARPFVHRDLDPRRAGPGALGRGQRGQCLQPARLELRQARAQAVDRVVAAVVVPHAEQPLRALEPRRQILVEEIARPAGRAAAACRA